MNPSASFATAGLSFQLSSPQKRDGSSFERRSDVRLHDGNPLALCTEVRPYSGCECFTRQQTTRRNHPNIRLSRYIAVCSGEAQSALTCTLILPDHEGVLMDYLLHGSDSSSPLKREASSEQLR